jgi:serine/threonine protein kinase
MEWELEGSEIGPHTGFDWDAVPYVLEGPLGRGGMAHVYRVTDPRLGRSVALKLTFEPKHRAAARERFLREGELTARLDHPHVIKVHDALVQGNYLALVYDLVEDAASLSDRWGDDIRSRVELLAQGAAGVAHAHAHGIVHRDLKPDNLLVDSAGQVRVTDFGLGFDRDLERLTQTGAAIGTPLFMAPEQYSQSRAPTPATDVWALGVLLYVALCDEVPFPGPTLMSLSAQTHAGATRSVMSLIAGQPPPLVELVRRSLQPDPSRRPVDASEFLIPLRAFLSGETPANRPWIPLAAVAAIALLLAGAVFALRTPEVRPSASPTSTLEDSSTPSTGPPARLLADLELEGPRSGFAALALRRHHPQGPHAKRVDERLKRLRREPLTRLRLKIAVGGKKDWEVGFLPGDPYVVAALADHSGQVASWDLRSGSLRRARRSKRAWAVGEVFPDGGLVMTKEEVCWIDFEGDAEQVLIPTSEKHRYTGVERQGDWVWVLTRDRILFRLHTARGIESRIRTPAPSDTGAVAAGAQVELWVALADPATDQTSLYRFNISAETWSPRLLSLGGQNPRVAYHPPSGRCAMTANGGALAVVDAKNQVHVVLDGGGGAFLGQHLAFTREGDHLLRWGRDPRGKGVKSRLDLIEVKTGAVRTTWAFGVRAGDLNISPCGLYAAMGLGNSVEDPRAVEVWYLGPEVWDLKE